MFALVGIHFVNAATYYVSPNGLSTNKVTQDSPLTIQQAANKTNAGDIVYFLTGTYNFTGLTINRSGTPSAYITYSAAPGALPVLQCQNPCELWNAINVQANYIKIEGLELIGNNANITLAQGESNYNEAVAGGTDSAKYGRTNTNGISIGNSNIVPHHIEVRNCKVHDFAGGGISAIKTDFITLENNKVYNTSWYAMYGTSGISIFHSSNSVDSYSDFSMIVRNNIVYNNKTLVKWIDVKKYSDGNGIIIDDNMNTQINGAPYKGSFLVENNLSYSNGGNGVYIMSSENALFRNNTSYWNSTEKAKGTGAGELVCYDSKNVTWVNNIGWANPSYGSVYAIVDDGAWGNNANITWKNNLSFNGTAGQSSVRINKTTTTSIDAPNILGVNPLFISPTTNFKLQNSSPAANAGTSSYGVSSLDLAGDTRVKGGVIDMGAYESSVTNTVTITAAPAQVYQSDTYNITVNYVTAENGKIWIGLFSPNWANYYSSNEVSVNAGNGTLTIPITLTDVAVDTGLHWNASFRNLSNVQKARWVQDNVTVLPNLVTNPCFNLNTTGWNTHLTSPASAGIASVTRTGYTDKASKTTITNMGNASWNIQLKQTIPLVAGTTYTVKFKASADAARTIDLMFQQGVLPKNVWKSQYGINLTTTPQIFGPYTFNCTTTDVTNEFRFLLGNNTSAVYIDDVEIIATTTSLAKKLANTKIENKEVADETKLLVYPNPVTNGSVNINLDNSQDKVEISIMDLQGKELYRKTSTGLNNLNINTSNLLKSGIYIIKIQGATMSKTQKLIVK
ncbi:putative secreted protein (Por secretion system target) [Flavobacterium circumlabens]|nr:putative secreted protein (Por secretion system target) [Flavobacterium circumlabens]